MSAARIVAILLESNEVEDIDPEDIAAEAGIPAEVNVDYKGAVFPGAFMSVGKFRENVGIGSKAWGTAVEAHGVWVKADVLNMSSGGKEEYLIRLNREDSHEQERRIVGPDFPVLVIFRRQHDYVPPKVHLKVAGALCQRSDRWGA